mgnify:CR=1 FL=1
MSLTGSSDSESNPSRPPPPPPLYIEALENLTVKFGNTYEYSKDNVTWTSGTSSTSISANAGERVFFRASGLTASSSSGIGTFTISNGNCNVGGNVMSMVYGADFDGKTEITQAYQFKNLFYVSSTSTSNMRIIDASGLALPTTAMTDYCYAYMFYNQKKLTSSPALPATTLANYCYEKMFRGCTSLVNAPALPATTLANYCYERMFDGCTSLNYIKAMFITYPSSSYMGYWVENVPTTGTFVKNSAATWSNSFGTSAIPSGWTVELADA